MACNSCCSVPWIPFSSPMAWRCTAPLASPTFDLPRRSKSQKLQENVKNGRKARAFTCKSMVQQTGTQGASASYAKEMERLSAKESMLLAFKDAGGFEALVTGKTTDIQLIDVSERIVSLERFNPTPRPTTSPYLLGQWNFDWFGDGSPGFIAARSLFGRFPMTLATLSKMDVLIKDGSTKITANLKFVDSIESKVTLSSKLSVEGPLRMKEEYVEGIIESPKINEEVIPELLKGAFDLVANAVKQLPAPIKDAVSSGLRIPLGGRYQRLFMISYLDEEILIIRGSNGMPEVLTRLDPVPSPMEEVVPEYES